MNPLSKFLAVLAAWGLLASGVCSLRANVEKVDQEQVEIAMVALILSYTEWPDATPDGPVQIGVFEDEAFLKGLVDHVSQERFQGRFTARLVRLEDELESLDGLQALFFSGASRRDIPQMIRRVGLRPIALMGAFESFLEEGGMINLVRRKNRVTFEIDLGRSSALGIEYRAKLLRLANRIVK